LVGSVIWSILREAVLRGPSALADILVTILALIDSLVNLQ